MWQPKKSPRNKMIETPMQIHSPSRSKNGLLSMFHWINSVFTSGSSVKRGFLGSSHWPPAFVHALVQLGLASPWQTSWHHGWKIPAWLHTEWQLQSPSRPRWQSETGSAVNDMIHSSMLWLLTTVSLYLWNCQIWSHLEVYLTPSWMETT